MAFNNQMMAQALRQRQPIQYPSGGGTVGRTMGQSMAMAPQSAPQQQQSQQPSLGQMQQNAQMMNSGMDKLSGLFGYGGTGADIGAGASQYGPEVAKMGGNVVGAGGNSAASPSWTGAISNLFGGGGGGGAGAGAGAGGGMMSSLGGLGALAGAAWLGDKEMNESKGSAINADKLNNMGTIGDSGIGLRAGDLVNGFNPATWASDPKKAAKGLGNAFTFGLLDKVI